MPKPVYARAVHTAHVEWADTDASGHYHNAAVIRYVEAAEAILMRERGLDGYFGAAPRVRYEVDFACPLWFGQRITATVVLEHVGTSSMTFRFEVWAEETDGHARQLAASGRYVTVHVPPGSSRRASQPWPAHWRAALERGTDSQRSGTVAQ